MLLFLLQAMEVDDAELMELMDHCEASGNDQDEQQDTATPTHIQQTEPEQTGTMQQNPPQTACSEEWNKPTIHETEGESEHSIREEKSSQEGQKDEGEMKRGRENGSEMQESKDGVWGQRVCHTHERAVPIQDTVEELDITEEGKDVVEHILFFLSCRCEFTTSDCVFLLRFGDFAVLPGASPSALGGTDALDALNVSPGVLRRTSRTPQAYQSVCSVFHTLQDFMYQATVTFGGIMFEDRRCSSIAVGQIDGVASNITFLLCQMRPCGRGAGKEAPGW